jgi:hypothetical protein
VSTHAAGVPDDLVAMAEAPDCPPAVVDLLVHSGRLTGDALAATVVDLAARGHVHLEQVAPGEVLCRIPHSAPTDDVLREHERQTMELLRSRAVDGVVPTGALGQGVTDEADGWWDDFTVAVMRESEAAGLSKGLGSWWSEIWEVSVWVVLALLFVGLIVAAAEIDDPDVRTAIVAVWFVVGLWSAIIADSLGRRTTLTPDGIHLGSRWIAMREQVLDLLPDDLGPAAATVRGRTLAFAAAVGTAPSVTRGLPRGPDSTCDAWVRRGGVWRRVRLRYPVRMPRGWGRPPLTTILPALVGVAAAGAVLWFTRADAEPLLDGGALVLLVIAGSELLAGLSDVVTSPREVEGPVVARWLFDGARWNPWRDLVPRRWYVVIDDGRSSRLRGLRVSEDAFHKAHRGDVARARVGRAQGFVHDIDISHTRVARG